MDVLVPAFVSAFVGEWGDKTQLLVAFLAARSNRPLALFAGLLVAAVASSLAAAYAGSLLVGAVPPRALGLMLGIALLFAGIAGLVRRRPPRLGSQRVPLFAATVILCLAAELGDRTQFLTFALAARFESPALAAAGASAGILAAGLPALALGPSIRTQLPERALRWTGAALFLAAGFLVAVYSLGLA